MELDMSVVMATIQEKLLKFLTCLFSFCFVLFWFLYTELNVFTIQGGPKITERHTSGNKDIR